MKVTDFTEKVTVQSPSTSVGSRGERTGSWTTLGTRRASVVFQTGSENSSGNQTNANTVYVVRFRYNSSLSINTSCRLLWDSKELYIMSIRNVDNRNEFYELRCGHSYEV